MKVQQKPQTATTNVAAAATAPASPTEAVADAAIDDLPRAASEGATFERSAGQRPPTDHRAGGDSRVVISAGGVIGSRSTNIAIDAHSTRAGDFTEPRTVDGQQLYFTPAGARALDTTQALAGEAARTKAHHDPNMLERLFFGDAYEGAEEHSGSIESKE